MKINKLSQHVGIPIIPIRYSFAFNSHYAEHGQK